MSAQLTNSASKLTEEEMARLEDAFDKTQQGMERLGASGSWVTTDACT